MGKKQNGGKAQKASIVSAHALGHNLNACFWECRFHLKGLPEGFPPIHVVIISCGTEEAARGFANQQVQSEILDKSTKLKRADLRLEMTST